MHRGVPSPLALALAALLIATAPLIATTPALAHGPLHEKITGLTRAIAENPWNAELYLERAEFERLDENPAAAALDLDRAEALDPTVARLPLCRAALSLDDGHPEEALRFATDYLARHPDDRGALSLRAEILDALGRPEAAAADRARLAAIEAAPRPGTTPETGATTAATLAIARGASWRYLATATDQGGTGWEQPGFADGSWPAGAAPLGFGETYIVTNVPFGPSSSNKWITTYFRTNFTLGVPPAQVTGLFLTASYDDGFRLFVNGHEIIRPGLPAAPAAIGWGTFAVSHEAGTYESFNLASAIPFLTAGTNVVAVELHQTAVTSTDLVWDADLTVSTGVTVVRGPYLQSGGTNRIDIRWRTDQAADSRVRWGASPATLTNVLDNATVTTEHEMVINSLAPDTRYYYSVGSTTAAYAGGDTTCHFMTAPMEGKKTKIWIVGDSGEAAGANAVRDGYLLHSGGVMPDLWLMLGDNAYESGTDAEYQSALFDVFGPMLKSSVLWPTRGNHDAIYAGPANDYYDIMTLPTAGEFGGRPSATEAWYSFNRGDIHFVCLDSEGSDRSPGGAMLSWLALDLAANTKSWTVAYWHHPPYTKGSHDSDNDADSGGRMRDMRQNALPILEANGVDLVLCGHSHSYERSCLLDEHYGYSPSLVDSMKLDPGDGDPLGDGAYIKATAGHAAPHEGAVYSVVGCSGRLGGGALNHPVMITSLDILGSMEVTIDALRLDGRFIDTAGNIRDQFTIVKGAPSGVPLPGRGAGERLIVSGAPNPFQSRWTLTAVLSGNAPVRAEIFDATGRRIRALLEEPHPTGPLTLSWDGRDDAGRDVPPGAYFARVVQGNRTASLKLLRTR